jgi:hypothetical protein
VELRVFVAKHCWGCKEAREIASQMQQGYPELTVEVIDLDGVRVEKPEEVFATPTYLLNGRVVSLGNPRPERLRKMIETELRKQSLE